MCNSTPAGRKLSLTRSLTKIHEELAGLDTDFLRNHLGCDFTLLALNGGSEQILLLV